MKYQVVLLRGIEDDTRREQGVRFQILETSVTEETLVHYIHPGKRLEVDEAFRIMNATDRNDQCMIAVSVDGQIVHGVWEGETLLQKVHPPSNLFLSAGFVILSKI